MLKLKEGRKYIILALCVMLCAVLSACGGEPFEDLEWDDEIYLSDDVLILEPGEEETFSVDNYDCLKNLKVQIDKNNTEVCDIIPGEEYEYTIIAKAEGERLVTFYASYAPTIRFRIIVARNTDKAWDKYYEEEEAREAAEEGWDDWDDLEDDWEEEDEYEYDPAVYETEEWTDMFEEEAGETVEQRTYNLNIHLESDDIATFIMADYLEVDPVDLPMANSSFVINKDGTFTMVVDNDEVKNSYITYINNIFDTIILSEALGYGYQDVAEMADAEGFASVDELRADRLQTLIDDMNDQWPDEPVGVTTFTGYVEKLEETIYLYTTEGDDLFDSCEMLEDGSINIDVFADDEINPIATDHTWIWR